MIYMAIETHEELLESYESFFTNFKDDNGDYKYIDQINRMVRDGKRSINIDYNDLVLIDDMRDLDLASTLMENPYFMLAAGSEALALHVKNENLDYYKEILLEKNNFYVRFHDTPSSIRIRDIRAAHVDTLKWLDGIVIRTTEIKSIITKAFYTCAEGHELEITFSDGVYFKPDRCINDACKAKEFNLDNRRSKLIDWQYITVQEKPEDLPPGASPKSISCRLTDDIVNAVRPGDRVHFGGLVRTKASKQIKKGQVLTFDSWIDINYIESLTKDDDFLNITPEEEKHFIDISNDPKIHEHIIQSIAPSIYGHNEVKEASMLLLFGGVTKTYPDGFSTRGQPNVLLIGDPGVAKSQMLRYVQSIAPRGIFTSGKGSSAAGLTAAIVRDPDTGEVTLEAGALVLADRGLCLIDEFDKMSENDRSAIHEAMEQHTVSIAKAGIVATLNARTGVFAAANPKYGRYEINRTFNENVNLSAPILSRFDLIFTLRDEPEEDNDSVIASHILNLHRFHGNAATNKPPMQEDELKKYIAYAKKNYHPVLSEEAVELIENYYVSMRSAYGKSSADGKQGDRVTITARQLEGIIRLSEARARAALRSVVTKMDAQKAIDLVKFSLSQIAIDPETGAQDIDALYSGSTGTKRNKLNKLLSLIDFLYKQNNGPFKEEELINEAEREGLAKDYVIGVLTSMRRDGTLYEPRPGMIDKP